MKPRRYPNKEEAAARGFFDKSALRTNFRLKPTQGTPVLRYWQGHGFVAAYSLASCVPMRPYRPPTSKQAAALTAGRALLGTPHCRQCGQREITTGMSSGVCQQCVLRALARRWAEQEAEVQGEAAIWLATDPLFVDTETTGLSETDQVVEIAILDRVGAVLFQSLVCASVPMNEAAAAVHGISPGELIEAPSWPAIYPQIRSLLSGRLVVAHNSDFDSRLIRQTSEAYGLPDIDATDWACTMVLLTEINGRRPRLAQAMELSGAVLPDTCQFHRAAFDAECCRRVVEALGHRVVNDHELSNLATG